MSQESLEVAKQCQVKMAAAAGATVSAAAASTSEGILWAGMQVGQDIQTIKALPPEVNLFHPPRSCQPKRD